MSRDMDLLIPAFREKVDQLLADVNARSEEYTLKPFFTLRSPLDQAKLWRQSRSTAEITTVLEMLERERCPFLVYCIEQAGPQHGRWATNALPGQSWHQWGEAIDCFVLNSRGKAVWSAKHEGYVAYAEAARGLGLEAGYFWSRKDAVHVQLRADSVRSIYPWTEIDSEMQSRFGVSTTE